MFVFATLLITLICHHASPAPVENGTIQDIARSNIPPQNCQYQYPQQVFHIYNSYCDGKNQITKIPDSYILTPGIGAHKLHLEKKNWNDARNICIKEGAHLSVIGSATEETMFATLMTDNKLHDVWLGVHELFKDGDWVTVQDKPLDNVGYKHWKQGEPNQAFENAEHCASYIQNEGMNDLNCNKELPFVCEIRFV